MAIIDVEQIEKNKQKIEMYSKEEQITIDSINQVLKKINTSFNENNLTKLEDIQIELVNKLKIISKIHSNDIMILYKNIDKYIYLSNKFAKSFDNISGGIL